MADDEIPTGPLADLWYAAIDAASNPDFRDEEGDLDEETYLRYQTRAIAKAEAAVRADERRKVAEEIGDALRARATQCYSDSLGQAGNAAFRDGERIAHEIGGRA